MSHILQNTAQTRPHILVVDDDVRWRRALSGELRSRFELTIVSSAEEARYVIKPGRFNALVLDIQLEGEDTAAFFMWLCLHAPGLADRSVLLAPPITHTEHEQLLRSRHGWTEFKPWPDGGLVNRVEALLELPTTPRRTSHLIAWA